MLKRLVCAGILGIFCGAVRAGNIDCVRFLHAGPHKICMKTLKETSPSVAVKIDDTIYYASSTPENRGGVRIEYEGATYSLYNRDETEYELIHWLSGQDALVDGVWRDRLADTTSDTGPLNFQNFGCVWNEEHNGYYSADGNEQYFRTSGIPTLDFGTDWYIEVVASVGIPLGDTCFFVDLASLLNANFGTGLYVLKNNKEAGGIPGSIGANSKANHSGVSCNTGNVVYDWGKKAVFITGENRYSINQSRAFITYDGNRYYGRPYDTWQWNEWDSYFFLFRGHSLWWRSNVTGETITGQCGPSTIYDIKIWRKK